MAETLSQAEIDALRAAVRSGRVDDVKEETTRAPAHEVKVVAYDFRKPQLLSAEHMLSLQLLHQAFVKHLQGLLFGMFKVSADISVAAMDQVNYGEFMLSLESPTYLLGAGMGEDGEPVGFELSPPLGQVILDMLLGGSGVDVAEEPPREFTALELDIMRSWIDRVIDELGEAWSSVREVRFAVHSQGVAPEQVQIVTPDTPCLCVVVRIKISDIDGRLHVCYPFNTLQSAFHRLDTESDSAAGQRGEQRKQALNAVRDVPLQARVELGRVKISARDLEALAVGDVLRLPTRVGDSLAVAIDESELARAYVGRRRGQVMACVQAMARRHGMDEALTSARPAASKPQPDKVKGSTA